MQINISKNNNRVFGIIFSIFFLFIGFYLFENNKIFKILLYLISFTFFVFAIFFPNIFKVFNKNLIKFGILIGKFFSPILMGFIYFFLITPISLIIRLLGIDPLKLQNKKKDKKTYWIERKEDRIYFNKQF